MVKKIKQVHIDPIDTNSRVKNVKLKNALDRIAEVQCIEHFKQIMHWHKDSCKYDMKCALDNMRDTDSAKFCDCEKCKKMGDLYTKALPLFS